jgi:hypothetical protein
VLSGDHPFDRTDALAADVCSTIKQRGDWFESDEELCSCLETDGVEFTIATLSVAMRPTSQLDASQEPSEDCTWRG